jgi:hypothetical protein
MAVVVTYNGDVQIQGNLTVTGTKPLIARSGLIQDAEAEHDIPFESWRVFDAYQTVLPGTSTGDDLGLYGGTFGTATPAVKTYDLKNAGATNVRARFRVQLPPWYDTGETVKIRFNAGMETTVASASATVDVEAYKTAGDGLVSGSDLVTTSATTINSLTLANKDFLLTSTALAPGDWLDCRVTIAINDSATATAVIGKIGKASLLLDIKG